MIHRAGVRAAGSTGTAIAVRRGRMHEPLCQSPEILVILCKRGRGGGCMGEAVIAALMGDDYTLGRLAEQTPVIASEFDRGFICFAAAGGEEHRLEIARREVSKPFRKANGGHIRKAAEGWGERDLAHLLGGGFGQLHTAMPYVDAPKTSRTIDQPLAVGQLHLSALSGYDQHRP